MALINITGGKYTTRTLSAVGTTSVTIGVATFVSRDFNPTQRMVALFSSAGAFKGIAWVRRFTSTTVLELENQFVDPVTGLFATQVVGDNLMVSRNASETANTADWVVTGIPLSTTTNDAVTFGTTSTNMSVCFYEENMDFNTRSHIRVVGGVVVFGKLMSYDGVSKESFVWSRECNVKPRSDYLNSGGGGPNAVQYNVFAIGTTAAHSFMFGGMVGGSYQSSNFLGSEGLTGLANGSFAFYGTRMNYGCASPSNGSPWPANPTRHLLYKTIHEARYTNANLIMWGDGTALPSFVSFPQYGTGNPLGIFRASSAVTFGSSSNNRTIVNDLGTGALVDDANASGVYTFKNVISPAINIVRFAGGTCPITMQFEDDYTNLKNRTTLVIQRGDGVTAASAVNTASSTFTATVTQATYSGTANGNATNTAFYTTFNYTVKCYGYGVVNGTHSTYTYSLGTAGNGTNLKLGGLINQTADTGVTLSETEALALSSKFTINSGTKVVTVTANANLDELYDYAVAWNCSSAANAVIPALNQYLLTYNGKALVCYAGWTLIVNTGVTLESGAKYNSVNFNTITLNGTGKITAVYTSSAGTSTIWQFQEIEIGSSIAVYDSAGVTKYYQGEVTTAGTYSFYIPHGVTGTYTYAVEKYGSKRETGTFPANAGGILFYVPDYAEDVGITEPVKATVQAYTSLETPSKVYDRTAVFRLTEQGIKIGQIFTRSGTALEVQTGYSHLINKDASAVMSISGGVITTKSTSYAGDSKYTTEIAPAPATITANTTEVITIAIEDALGNSSVTINGGDGTFELWKVTTATATNDYATGTLLDTVGNVTYRFIGTTGFDIVGVDINSNIRRRSSMAKGVYTQAFYVGDQIQLAQAPQVIENGVKLDILQVDIDTLIADLEAVKGAGFTTTKQSLVSLRKHITNSSQF